MSWAMGWQHRGTTLTELEPHGSKDIREEQSMESLAVLLRAARSDLTSITFLAPLSVIGRGER